MDDLDRLHKEVDRAALGANMEVESPHEGMLLVRRNDLVVVVPEPRAELRGLGRGRG